MNTSHQNQHPVSYIQLQGAPYQGVAHNPDGTVVAVDCNASLNELAHNTGYVDTLPRVIDGLENELAPLLQGGGYYDIDAKLKHGKDLTFEEAFTLVTLVASALNRPLDEALQNKTNNGLSPHETRMLQATALLSAMSTKEAYRGLTAEEIAGMVAATVTLDTVVRTRGQAGTIAFGGMGGDLGYPLNGHETKLFSLSTLGAIALATRGPVHKHHSYPNTSKVAGQSAIEAYGARSDFHRPEDFDAVLSETGLVMSSCHNTRTLHTLSHRLRGETVNHVIGPLAFTMSPETGLIALIGVNEKIHPDLIAKTLQILNDRGFQAYGNSAVFCGTNLKRIPREMLDADTYYRSAGAQGSVRIDEIAPPPYSSMVAFSRNGQPQGTFQLRPEDFYTRRVLRTFKLADLVIPNTREDILHYNDQAVRGLDPAKARYLAMTIGLGIFTREYLDRPDALNLRRRRVNKRYLREATAAALDILTSGQALGKLTEYVHSTQQHAGK